MTGPGQPTWVSNFVRVVPAVVELLAFSNHDTRMDGRTDGHTDGHHVINNIDKRSRGEWLELVDSATTTTFTVSTSERSSSICSVKMHYGVFMSAFVNFHHILLGDGGGKQLNTHEA